MSQTLRIVVSCTDRKRLSPVPEFQLRTYPEALPERSDAWIARLANPETSLTPAEDLYQGEHWSIARQLPALATARGISSELWIASAGYGLIRSDELVEAYAATFATRGPDSITRKTSASSPLSDGQFWWDRLSQRKRSGTTPASIAELAANDPSSPLIVALSATYIRAVRADLTAGAAELKDPSDLMLVAAGVSDPGLANMLLPVDARLQHLVGGTRRSLNVRIARHMVEQVDCHRWDAAAVRRMLADDLSRQPKLVKYERRHLTDEEVRTFIRDHLADESGLSRSTLLRRLRDGDLACEQKRFSNLFDSVFQGTSR